MKKALILTKKLLQKKQYQKNHLQIKEIMHKDHKQQKWLPVNMLNQVLKFIRNIHYTYKKMIKLKLVVQLETLIVII